jgi:hypothetical protein
MRRTVFRSPIHRAKTDTCSPLRDGWLRLPLLHFDLHLDKTVEPQNGSTFVPIKRNGPSRRKAEAALGASLGMLGHARHIQ